MGYDWDFHMIFAGYEWWWLKGLAITIVYACATVAGGSSSAWSAARGFSSTAGG